MHDYDDHLATPAEADREYATNVGSERPDVPWILSDRDVWYRNPHYKGKPVPHPEDDCYYETDNQPTETDMDMQRIEITYCWNSDPGTPYDATAAIGEYDGESNDDDIFYWFAPGEEILGDHGEFTVTSAECVCGSCGGAGFIKLQPTKEEDMLRITEQDKMIAVPTGSAAALTDGLAIAIEALEEFYGSDESETLTHLRNILATHGVRKGD